MKIKVLRLILFLIILLLPFGFLISTVAPDLRASAVDTFVPYESSSELTLDGVADEAAWAAATTLIVTTIGGDLSLTQITLKAVYTDTNIYIFASWADSTFSITRGRYNVSGYVYDEHLVKGGSEDRIVFMWEIGTVAGFNGSGCQVMCHSLDDHVELSAGELADMWHIKVARGVGLISATDSEIIVDTGTYELTAGTVSLHGYADDNHVNDIGIQNDAGDGSYKNNEEDDHAMWIETDHTTWIDAMILTEAEITAGEVINVTKGVAGGWTNCTFAANTYEELNANVPRNILRTPTLSQGDIEIALKWVDGVYTLETKRALNTGNADDIAFDPTEDGTYLFSVALFDNQGQGEEHGDDHNDDDDDDHEENLLEHSIYTGPIALTFGVRPVSPSILPNILIGAFTSVVVIATVGTIVIRKRKTA
ncbi:hypothetical protein LCGC14_1133880 [marine sediment metagenome]|uniref:Cytochrome c-552/DMSO reductase-like haem-binding domain-containing protein n=1 Tax=marine sediment metagenome TaxID=412755 RepID=A0A0F9MN91_9ZZZZ|nr:hypothetical protein [archaeon]